MTTEGFGGQSNPTLGLIGQTYSTAYTIPATKFKANTNYILMLQWQMSEPSNTGVTFASRVMHNGIIVPNGEFLGHSQIPNVQPNCMVLTRITQPLIPVPIIIQVKSGSPTLPVFVKSVRWIVIDESTLVSTDYAFNQSTTPIQLSENSSNPDVVSVNIPITNEEWTIFYCNKLLSDIPFSGLTCNVKTYFNIGTDPALTSPDQGFNGPGFFGVNRVATMMMPQLINAPSGTTASIFATKNQLFGLTNAVTATGSIFAIKTSVLQGTTARANTSLLPTMTKLIPAGNWLVWHCGWNLNIFDPPVVSNGNSLSSDSEGSYGAGGIVSGAPTVSSSPIGYDFRVDNLIGGTYPFIYNDFDVLGNGIQGVFLLRDPVVTSEIVHTTDALLIGTKLRHTSNTLLQAVDVTKIHSTDSSLAFKRENDHSTDSMLKLFRMLGHSTDSTLLGSFNISHSTDSFTADFTVRGTALFLAGADFDVSGVVTNTENPIDPSCMNRRILSKYGWEPTSTPNKTFGKCDIKR